MDVPINRDVLVNCDVNDLKANTLYWPSSIAAHSVILASAAFVAEYMAMPGGWNLALDIEEILTIDPPLPRSFMLLPTTYREQMLNICKHDLYCLLIGAVTAHRKFKKLLRNWYTI